MAYTACMDKDEYLKRAFEIQQKVDQVMNEHPDADADIIRQTFVLLNMKPIDRLRRGLLRGRKQNIQR